MREEEIKQLRDLLVQLDRKLDRMMDNIDAKLDRMMAKIDLMMKKLDIESHQEQLDNSLPQKGAFLKDIDGQSQFISWETIDFSPESPEDSN